MTQPTRQGTALITGASAGIGAIYADRLARRGYDLVLVARSRDKLETLAAQLTAATGRHVEILVADLVQREDQHRVEARLAAEPAIDVLVNNAGVSAPGSLDEVDPARYDDLLDLNIAAVARLARAAAVAMIPRRRGTIINVSSVMSVFYMPGNAVYSASKSFVLTLTQALAPSLAEHGVRIQAVLPGATRTEIWEKAGVPLDSLPAEILMDTDEMVDAALAGLDQGETVTIPSLPDVADWEAFEAARNALAPNLSRDRAAPRYRLSQAAE
ncbi:MAG TPA: SDR family oxidoreductase [Devosiaceae bacterium]